MFSEHFYPCAGNEKRKEVRGTFIAQLLKILEVK